MADRQVKGRGRAGNAWTSPDGCLMFSYSQELGLDGRLIPFVQYVVCLAVTEAVARVTGERLGGNSEVGLRIKWPNDIYNQEGSLKVGGILCQSTYREGHFQLVAGLGLNLDNEQPTTCINRLLEEEAGRLGLTPPRPVGREELLAALLQDLEDMTGVLLAQGFGPLRDLYLSRWLHSGQAVQAEAEEPGVGVVHMTIEGIAPSGFLLGRDARGQGFELHPDGNSFDFMRGLIRKKVV